MNGVTIRDMQPGEEHAVIALVSRVFSRQVAPLYTPQGVDEFFSYANAAALARRLASKHNALVALDPSGELIGMTEVREGRHLSMLFVDTARQRSGIGRMLLQVVIDRCRQMNPALDQLTVHSSPNAVGAYQKFGFRALSPEQEKNGIRFVPMSLGLEADNIA